MATIIQIPGALSIAGNIPDIILDSAVPVNFKILLGAEVLLDETYDPDANNKITIHLRDLLPSLLSVSIPNTDVFEQTAAVKTFTFNIGGVTSNHVVVVAGVDADVDPTIFLKGNWLTWQLQQKRVKYLDPEWLSYYATEASVVMVKAYFKVGDPVTITLANLTSGKFYSLNVNFQHISGLFEGQPVYFDIWTETAGAVQLSFVQRYVLMNDYFDSEDLFVFVNSLGGIDTIRFTGEKEEDNKFDISSALFDEDTLDYDVDFSRVYTKSVGYFAEDRERVWSNEFFNSTSRYLVTADGLKKVTVSAPMAKYNDVDRTNIEYEFKFALSRQTKYLNFARAEELPAEVEIIDPDTEVFFLAPRLNEFPAATLDDLLLFPVQMPFTQQWQHLPYSAIKQNFLEELASMGAFDSEWGKIYGSIEDQADLVAALDGKADATALAAKADLVEGKVPLEQLPDFGEDWTGIIEIVNKGQPNALLNLKLPVACDFGMMLYANTGQFPASIWEDMPYATDAIKGGIIYDPAIFEKNESDQLTVKAGVLTPAAHNHDTLYPSIARVDALEAMMSTDAERIAAINELTANYSAADTALNDTLTAALVQKAPKDNPVFTTAIEVLGQLKSSYASASYSYLTQTANGGVIDLRNSAGIENVIIRSYGDSHFNGGNIGIGTTNPLGRLDVKSLAYRSAAILLSGQEHYADGNNSSGGIELNIGVNRTNNRQFWIKSSDSPIDNSARQIRIVPALGQIDSITTDGTTYKDLVLNAAGGNIGVGTVAPEAKMDINGNTIIRGTLMIYTA